MLFKLAIGNAKRSIKDYLIYIVTITIAFSLMFSFNLISNHPYLIPLGGPMAAAACHSPSVGLLSP